MLSKQLKNQRGDRGNSHFAIQSSQWHGGRGPTGLPQPPSSRREYVRLPRHRNPQRRHGPINFPVGYPMDRRAFFPGLVP